VRGVTVVSLSKSLDSSASSPVLLLLNEVVEEYDSNGKRLDIDIVFFSLERN